jgi:hypothetical protein
MLLVGSFSCCQLNYQPRKLSGCRVADFPDLYVSILPFLPFFAALPATAHPAFLPDFSGKTETV